MPQAQGASTSVQIPASLVHSLIPPVLVLSLFLYLCLLLPPFLLLNGRSVYLTRVPVAFFSLLLSCSAAFKLLAMAVVKLLTSTFLFYILNSLRDYWYPLIQWAVNWVVIASISWYIGRRITRYIICQKVLPRVEPSDKGVLITGEKPPPSRDTNYTPSSPFTFISVLG